MESHHKGAKLPLARALGWIFLSTLLISGTSHIAWFYYLHVQRERSLDPAYTIEYIVQDCQRGEALNTLYLAELLQLSVDRPTNLYRFNASQGQQNLLQSPLIQKATVQKVYPNALYVQYSVRTPIAFLGDYHNVALDQDGVIFPLTPFFSPKKLPEIILGIKESGNQFGKSVKGHQLKLAFDVLKKMEQIDPFLIRTIDVSKAFLSSLGSQEIVVTFEEKGLPCTYFLRLSPKNYLSQLGYLQLLREPLTLEQFFSNRPSSAAALIVDLRLSQLAFVKECLPPLEKISSG